LHGGRFVLPGDELGPLDEQAHLDGETRSPHEGEALVEEAAAGCAISPRKCEACTLQKAFTFLRGRGH